MIVKDSTANKVHDKSKNKKGRKGVSSEPGEAVKNPQVHNKGLLVLGPRSQRSSLIWPGQFKKKMVGKVLRGHFLSKHDKDYIQP